MLVIGSTALKHYFPLDYPREPKDLDYVVQNSNVFTKEKGVEYLENPVILKYQKEGFLSPDLLLTLKMSHLFWEVNWRKHMYDVQFLLDKGYRWNEKILNELIQYWEQTEPKVRRSNLSLNAEEFFNNAINDDENEHDFLHTLINPVPMYTKLLKDGCEVELDEGKWDNLPFEEKCDVVFEETSVMAFERYKKTYYKAAYELQLEQNIQKHFPRYIAIFAILNYKKLVKPNYNYKLKIENGLSEIK